MTNVTYLRHGIFAAAFLLLATAASALGLQERFLDGNGLAFQQLRVEGKGVVTEVTGACPTVVLTIAGIPVTVDANTVFSAGQTCGMLAPNQRVDVRGTLTISGGTLSVVATMIEVEDGLGRHLLDEGGLA